MKDISIYFQPISVQYDRKEGSIGAVIQVNDDSGFPDVKKGSIALITIPEYRRFGASFESVKDIFREDFYGLFIGDNWTRGIYDLGEINPGERVEDSYFALSQVVAELIKNDVIPIIVGGGQDLTLACYKGYEALEQMINICSVDSMLNVGDPGEEISSDGYVSHLLMQRPCYLFNYANIGMQRPFVPKKEIELFEKLYFDICRLGEFNGNFRLAEPYLRNSDLLTIDFNSVKNSESDPTKYQNANGFKAEQLCQIARYAGISDKLNCFAIFDVIPGHNSVAQNLLAQVIWYFMDGVSQRVGDFPIGTKKNYKKFHVHLDDFDEDLVFYKSDRSGRWWLEVKYLSQDSNKYERHCMVPCNQEDYDNSLENIIPDLWWKTLQKMTN